MARFFSEQNIKIFFAAVTKNKNDTISYRIHLASNLVTVDYLEQVTGQEYIYWHWVVRFLPIMVKNELYFTLTMHIAYGFLEKGTISPDEFSTFLDEMQEKYACEKVRMSRSKLISA